MPFMVRARRPTSSCDSGSGTRSCRVVAEISATRRVSTATGRNDRPTSSHVSPPIIATSAGTTHHSAVRIAPRLMSALLVGAAARMRTGPIALAA